jgi:hypothetical protein
MINMNEIVGRHSVVFLTFDTLRYDVAASAFHEGRTANLADIIPQGWELRHSPGTFTLAAHQAFFAGFLPTPASPGIHPRLFAAHFQGSETTTSDTYVFKTSDIVSGFKELQYRTVCIGGVGFFNKLTPLGNVLPSLFEESYWQPEFGVTNAESTEQQFSFAARWIGQIRKDEKFFMFINISAIHQPNCFYKPGETKDSIETHKAALEYVDRQLPILAEALKAHGDTFCVFCSDHGTAYGEDGYSGHRLSHPVVLNVPYAEVMIKKFE